MRGSGSPVGVRGKQCRKDGAGRRKGKKGLEKEGKDGKLKEISSCFSETGVVIESSVWTTSAHRTEDLLYWRAPSLDSNVVQAGTKQSIE